jgi:hypothetical protein
MRKRVAIALLLVAGSLSLLVAPVWAQDEDLFTHKEVFIVNGTNKSLTFYLKNDKTDWASFALSPGASQLYKNTDQIFIRSESGSVNYRLKKNKRYRLYWNGDRELYDLVMLK